MRIGSLVYATNSGLGILARDFVRAGVVTDVAVIAHGHHDTNWDWHPGALRITSLGDAEQVGRLRQFCEAMDAMLFFETPFLWGLIPHCRAKGVPTALMPMYECGHRNLREPQYKPDLFINPSALDQRYYPDGVFIPVPCEGIPWRERKRAKTFLHSAGHGGLKGRNGTAELIKAMEFVDSDVHVTVRSQSARLISECDALSQRLSDGARAKLDLEFAEFPREEIYAHHDAFVYPEKFNGLSLPLQEARAAGMLVMCGDRFPMNEWLPREPLIKVAGYRKDRIGPAYEEYDSAMIEPRDIAAKVDAWADAWIDQHSRDGKAWAEEHSWAKLKPRYVEALEGLVRA